MPESLLLQVSWRKGWELRIGNCKALALSVGDPEHAMPVFSAKRDQNSFLKVLCQLRRSVV